MLCRDKIKHHIVKWVKKEIQQWILFKVVFWYCFNCLRFLKKFFYIFFDNLDECCQEMTSCWKDSGVFSYPLGTKYADFQQKKFRGFFLGKSFLQIYEASHCITTGCGNETVTSLYCSRRGSSSSASCTFTLLLVMVFVEKCRNLILEI